MALGVLVRISKDVWKGKLKTKSEALKGGSTLKKKTEIIRAMDWEMKKIPEGVRCIA